MRSLSGTLLAAQKEASREPYVRVEVLDMLAGVVRPACTRLYSGPEGDSHHALAVPSDGSVVRARLVQPGGDLQVQRTASPGPGADFSNWSSLDTAGPSSNIAMCSRGASVLLFLLDPLDGHTIYARESGDCGATWGGRQTVTVAPVDVVNWMAAAYSSAGVPALFFASGDQRVFVTMRTGGQWSVPSEWPHSVSLVTGLACAYQGDWLLGVTGKDGAGGWRLWSLVYGDGGSQGAGTWSPLREVDRAAGDSQVELRCPFLVHPDVARLSWVEKYAGAAPYQRPHLRHTLAGTTYSQNAWKESLPFDFSGSSGLALAVGGGELWLSAPSGVWRGSIAGGSVDVTQDVVAVRVREDPTGGRAAVTLRNDDGRYGVVGSGQHAAIRHGSEVRVSPGYVTAAGAEVSQGPAFWVTGWSYRSEAGRGLFVLEAADGWWLLEGWRCRRQLRWASGEATALAILTDLLGRAGIALSAPSPSPTIATVQPELTVHPGESAATAVRRLLGSVPDVLGFRGHQALLRFPQGSDATDYALGTDHPVHGGRYSQAGLEGTRVQVYGAAGMGEAFDWGQLPLVGERLVQRHDLNQGTVGMAEQRAQELLRGLEVGAVSGEVTAPPNCGQELYDVVEVTDARAGLSAARRRVAALELEYRRDSRPVYLQGTALSGV